MILPTLIVSVLLALWSVYWAGAAFGIKHSLSGWFAARENDGWRAEFAEISTSGYPVRHVTRLKSPALADPETGTAWQADWIAFASPAVWPGHMTLQFAETPQRLSYFDQTVALSASGLKADLRLHPGISLQLETMALTAGPWRVTGQAGMEMGATNLVLAMRQGDRAEAYRFEVEAQDFAPGPEIRQLLARGERLPDGFESLRLEMTVLFDRPWDRRALEDRRPQPARIDLKRADVQWGALRLRATGSVTIAAGVSPRAPSACGPKTGATC